MGKTGKRKAVGIDFKRAKYKVGKKLPLANNETKVDFKSRSINLPSQSVAETNDAVAVTSRNLTIKTVFNQCNHYSHKVRKESIVALLELLREHPDECRRHTATLVDKLMERCTDSSGSVRSALKDALAQGVLQVYNSHQLSPFLPIMLAHITSALTHIEQAVRLDGLHILEVVGSAMPDQLMATHLPSLLSQYSDLLGYGGGSKGVQLRPMKTLSKIVDRLQRLLSLVVKAMRAAECQHSAARVSRSGVLFSERCAAPPLATAQQLSVVWGLLERASRDRGPLAIWRNFDTAVAPELQVLQQHTDMSTGHSAAVQQAAAALNTRLCSCWVECCPGQLASGPEVMAVECMAAILSSVNSLGYILSHNDEESAGLWLRLAEEWQTRLRPFFPAAIEPHSASPALHQPLAALNKAAASIMGHAAGQ